MPARDDGFRALIVEDELLYAQAIARALRKKDIVCDVANTGREARKRSRQKTYQLILMDHRLPDDDGILLIPVLRAQQGDAAVVVMTAFETIASAIQAIRLGAEDYLVKETNVAHIVAKAQEVRRRNEVREGRLGWADTPGSPLGQSPAMKSVVGQLARVARGSHTTVLLTGETGVGKEVAAHHLHTLSFPAKEERPFVAVDCIALPSGLAESALFGHERGAFTGAERDRSGAFEDAGTGTVLLDEIGDMDLAMQGKLLRVLESRCYQRVGSSKERRFQGRVVAATNRNLAQACDEGRFRFDLYQRLSTFPVELPPLRERGEDILLLAEHFQAHFAQGLGLEPGPIPPEVRDVLLTYDYPGNIRELKNIIERAVIMSESGELALHHLPERMLNRSRVSLSEQPRDSAGIPLDFVPGVDTLATMESRMIEHALGMSSGVKSEAARILGISRFQLQRRMEKHGLTQKSSPES